MLVILDVDLLVKSTGNTLENVAEDNDNEGAVQDAGNAKYVIGGEIDPVIISPLTAYAQHLFFCSQ